MYSKVTKFSALLLCFVMLLSLVACATTDPGEDGTLPADTTTAETTPEETKPPEYDYGNHNFEGYTFTVLNYDERWGTNLDLAFAEASGDQLENAIWERNQKVEGKLNYKLVETFPTASGDKVILDMVTQAAATGDQTFAAAYLPVGDRPGIITEGSLLDLNTVDSFKFEEDYWDSILNDGMEITGKLFTASSPMHLMTFDLTWAILFNEKLFEDMKLEKPYQLVRDGKWTIDKFNEYITAATQSRGDASFVDYSDDGKCVYGVVAHGSVIMSTTVGCGYPTMKIAPDGTVTTFFDSEGMVNLIEKLATMYRHDNGTIRIQNSSSKPGYYTDVFRAGRAAFQTAELKETLNLRDMESTFGVLPFPKLDENQKTYYSNITRRAHFLTIPVSEKNPERVGVIADALSYESTQSILPIYYDVVLAYKGVRNQDSVEMLDIIRSTRAADFGIILTSGGKKWYDDTGAMFKADNVTYASWLAENKEAVINTAKEFVASMK